MQTNTCQAPRQGRQANGEAGKLTQVLKVRCFSATVTRLLHLRHWRRENGCPALPPLTVARESVSRLICCAVCVILNTSRKC